MFHQTNSNSLNNRDTNHSSQLSTRIFTKFISAKRFGGYMGEIYMAQALMSSKFPCNQQPEEKNQNQGQ